VATERETKTDGGEDKEGKKVEIEGVLIVSKVKERTNIKKRAQQEEKFLIAGGQEDMW